MRLRGLAGGPIAPLGMGAALASHGTLQLIAALGLGARTFAEHEHSAVGPVVVVELMLTLCMLAAAVREALGRVDSAASYAIAPQSISRNELARAAVAIASIAAMTLFGMEFSESPSTALGLGWLGGTLFPGAFVLALFAAAATALLHAAICGRVAGLSHLVALCAAALAILSGLVAGRALVAQPIARGPRLALTSAPSSRHGGLRAPPTFR